VAVEEVRFACSAAPLRLLDQRDHITIQHLGLAVIRVQGHIDGITLSHAVHVLGDGDGPKGMSLRDNPEQRLPLLSETWMMPSLLLSAKALQDTIGRCQGGDIDGRVGELFFEA